MGDGQAAEVGKGTVFHSLRLKCFRLYDLGTGFRRTRLDGEGKGLGRWSTVADLTFRVQGVGCI